MVVDYFGKQGKIVFTPSNSEVVVTYESTKGHDVLKDIIKTTGLKVISIGRNRLRIKEKKKVMDHGIVVMKLITNDPKQTFADALNYLDSLKNKKVSDLDYTTAYYDLEGNVHYFGQNTFLMQLVQPFGMNWGDFKQYADNKIHSWELKEARFHKTPGFYTLAVPEGSTLFDTLSKYNEKKNEVLAAEPDEFGIWDGSLWTPTEPDYTNFLLWGLKSTNGVWDINAEAAWNSTAATIRGEARSGTTDKLIVVVIDTGSDLNHPDLGDGLRSNFDSCYLPQGGADWDFTGVGTVPNDSQSCGHGTTVVAAIAELSRDDFTDGVGVAPRACIMPLRVDLCGISPYSDRIDAINYIGGSDGLAASNPSIRYIVNLSWKCNNTSLMSAAISSLVGQPNVLVIAAAGNKRQNSSTYPALYANVLKVGAYDSTGNAWNNPALAAGNEGAGTNYGANVIFAPGVGIKTAGNGDNYPISGTGTSISCAFASGVAALMWCKDYQLNGQWNYTPTQIRNNIISTATNTISLPIPPFPVGTAQNRKQINAQAAVASIT